MRSKSQFSSGFRCALNFTFVSAVAFHSCVLVAQQPDRGGMPLGIGVKAPALDIENWVSNREGAFESVTEFEEGRIYVVEFWATWCGPCIASMPHLAEIQERYYEDGVQIVSVTDEDLDTIASFLRRNVNGEEGLSYAKLTSGYCLTSDPDQSTRRDYIEASGQTGIPVAFIVGMSGLIEWIGHPENMDKPLQEIIADKWDREAFKVEMEIEMKRQDAVQVIWRKLEKSIQEAEQKLAAGDDASALAIMDSLIENKEFESMRPRLIIIRANQAVAMKGPEALKAFEAGVESIKEYPKALYPLACAAVAASEAGKQVQPELLAAAMKVAQTVLEAYPKLPNVHNTVAHLFYLQGDLDKAIASQEMAVEYAGDSTERFLRYLNQLRAEKAAR